MNKGCIIICSPIRLILYYLLVIFWMTRLILYEFNIKFNKNHYIFKSFTISH